MSSLQQLRRGDPAGASSSLKSHGTLDSSYPRGPEEMEPPSAASLPRDESSCLGCTDADMSCSDLLSLRSDSVSIAGSRRSGESQDDDTRSIAASSVMSLMQRSTLGPLEKDWIRSCATGNAALQRLLLDREPGLLHKKDFITGFTGLHWAAKLGLQDTVELMICSGADVNTRLGYTPLHLASIHGHRHIIAALVDIYNAKTNIRDYHGKRAEHYWTGSTDIFNKPDTVAAFSQRRRTQQYPLRSRLLSRSRSQEHIRLEFHLPHSNSQETMEMHF